MPPTVDRSGKWTYPDSGKVLGKVGLKSLVDYIRKRRSTVMRFIVERPIHALCMDAERQRGTASRQYWWQLPVNLPSADEAESSAGSEDDESTDSGDDSEGVPVVTEDEGDLGS